MEFSMLQQLKTEALKIERRFKTALFIIADTVILWASSSITLKLQETISRDSYPLLPICLAIFLSIFSFYNLGLYNTLARHLSVYTLRLVLFCSATNVALIFLATIAIDIHISLRDLALNLHLYILDYLGYGSWFLSWGLIIQKICHTSCNLWCGGCRAPAITSSERKQRLSTCSVHR